MNTSDKTIRYLYYEDLHFIPLEMKQDPIWAAQCLIFSKYNARPLLDADKAERYRNIDKGIIDPKPLKKALDPLLADGSGGKAEYIAADWKANPIYIHVNNIVEADMEKIPMNMFCKAVDEFAMEKQQKENMRILGRREFIRYVNDMNKELGFPELKPNEDPYTYARQMQQKLQGQPMTKGGKDVPMGLVDSIKSAIYDNEDLALFNEFIYKGDVEIAIELGIKHYLQKNKFHLVGSNIISDIRNFNLCAGRYYTSQTSGLPVVEDLDPVNVWTSPFKKQDGSDITYWFMEYDVTFSDFMRMFGAGRTKEELREIFDHNKRFGSCHGMDWDRCKTAQRMAARIRIGYHEWESQDCEVYAEGNAKSNLSFRKKKSDWQPNKNAPKKFSREERNYNVWYKCYYLPIGIRGSQSMVEISDFEWQSKYIFDFGKLQDQQRFGEDDRFSKSSLVVWKGKGMSFADVMDRYMPKIHLLWQKYQNYLVRNDVFKVYSNELMNSMMDLTDDANKNGKDSKLEWIRMLEQTGAGIGSFLDEKGNQIDPIKVFSVGYMKSAMDTLNQIQMLYDQMTRALGISDIREGLDPKPRTSLGGLQLAAQASNNATYFIEKAYVDVYIEFANRLMQYIIMITKEGGERLEQFKHIVGQANGLLLESIKDIPFHQLGLHIENVNTDGQMQYLRQLADSLVKNQQLDIEVLNILIKTDNYKYASVLMIMKYKQKQRELQQQAEVAFQRDMQLKGTDLKIKQAEIKAKYDGEAMVVQLGKQYDAKIIEMEARLKANTQAMLKDIIKNNRIEEHAAITDIDISKGQEKIA